jgi:hypothetical protein
MQTVTESPATRKPVTAFYAHLFDQPGALTKVGGSLYFITEADDSIVDVEPSMINFLCVLGQMQLADAARIDDLMHGGYAGRACSRPMEVA